MKALPIEDFFFYPFSGEHDPEVIWVFHLFLTLCLWEGRILHPQSVFLHPIPLTGRRVHLFFPLKNEENEHILSRYPKGFTVEVEPYTVHEDVWSCPNHAHHALCRVMSRLREILSLRNPSLGRLCHLMETETHDVCRSCVWRHQWIKEKQISEWMVSGIPFVSDNDSMKKAWEFHVETLTLLSQQMRSKDSGKRFWSRMLSILKTSWNTYTRPDQTRDVSDIMKETYHTLVKDIDHHYPFLSLKGIDLRRWIGHLFYMFSTASIDVHEPDPLTTRVLKKMLLLLHVFFFPQKDEIAKEDEVYLLTQDSECVPLRVDISRLNTYHPMLRTLSLPGILLESI